MPQIFDTRDVARPHYYDRDPIAVFAGYDAQIGPGPGSVVAQYSPPYPYANFGEIISVVILRITAPTVNALVTGTINIAPFYGGEYSVASIQFLNAAVGAKDALTLINVGYIAYGDTLKLYKSDQCTGGAVQWNMHFKGTEFQY